MANERFVTIENRIFNAHEGRTTVTGGTGWFSRTLHTIGSGNVKDIFVILDHWIKSAGSSETNLANPFTIDKITFEIVGQPLKNITFGGNRQFTVTSGLCNHESDISTASELKSTVSLLPIGQEIWVKAQGNVSGIGSTYTIPSCVRSSADASGTQFGWYNSANTTIVNDADVAGAFTWTGTTPDLRSSGWAPQIGGHFEDGTDPVVMFFDGDSITQGLQDNTGKRTGRGWPQYVLYGDGTSSPSTGIRAGFNAGVSGDSFSTRKTATKMHSKCKYCTDISVATGTNDVSINGSGNPTSIHADKLALKNLLVAAIANTRAPKTMFIQLQPQSTSGSPTKAINSAPNTGWGVDEKSAQLNALAAAEVGTNVTYYIQTPSIRISPDPQSVDHYLWKDLTYTPDGQHPGNVGVVAWAADVNPTYRLIEGSSVGQPSDSTPNSFTLTPVTNVALSTVIASNTVTLSGTDAPATISVLNGEYQINGGSWVTTNGTISPGQTFAVRRTSSSANSTALSTTLTIGGVSSVFTVTTAAAAASDTTPDSFSFTPATNVALSTVSTSNAITVGGINAASSISVTGGEYSISGGAWTSASGTVTSGQSVAVRRTSSASNSTAATVTLTIGGISATYTVTTLEAVQSDTTPNAFSFSHVTGAGTEEIYTSNPITVTGITAAADISISNGEYRINNGAWTSASGLVSNADTVAVRRSSSQSNSTTVSTVLNIGGVAATFSITTVAGSVEPVGIASTSMKGTGARSMPMATLDASGTLSFSPGKSQILLIVNGTSGELTPRISGSDANEIEVKGVGYISLSSGYQCRPIPPGENVAIPLISISSYLKGDITITGAAGAKACILEF